MVFLPSGQDLSNARDQLAAAQARADAAKREAARADTLIRDRVITEREHEIATTNLAIAEAELRAARARNAVVRQGDEVADSAALGSMELSAPRDGVLWGVWVSAGQTVAASAPLFEVIDLDPAWIRVPVYAGDAAQVARGEAALVRPLGSDTRDAGRRASPAPAPPSASPLTASVDLYYEVRNADRAFRPQQRVTVAVPLQSSEEALVVPRTAVVYDINGGTWVYVRVREHVYSRQRIEVRSIAGDMAVLARGPAPGTVVVTNGAAELFGTEFGAAH
jgi:RND family efflux transporter MFP subunit